MAKKFLRVKAEQAHNTSNNLLRVSVFTLPNFMDVVLPSKILSSSPHIHIGGKVMALRCTFIVKVGKVVLLYVVH